MENLNIKEFMQKYRPDGKGRIIIGTEGDSNTTTIEFTEIICDSCNDEITQPEEDQDKKVLWVDEGGGYCEKCYKKYFKKENDRK